MSGNSSQRKQARDMKELLELGRQQKDSIEAHHARIALKDEEIVNLHKLLADSQTNHRRTLDELEGMIQRSERLAAEVVRFREDSSSEVARLAGNLTRNENRRELLENEVRLLQERLQIANERLVIYDRDGAVTRAEHEKAVVEETKKLRDRLRRKTETLLRARVRFGDINRAVDPKSPEFVKALRELTQEDA